MLPFLDGFFLVFHTAWTLFNLTGWIFKITRKAHRITLLLTAASWGILGIRYGFGYCLCTDWHWQILEKLGETGLPYSYITYLITRLTGIEITHEEPIINLTLITFAGLMVLTVWLWILEKRKKMNTSKKAARLHEPNIKKEE